MVNEKDLIEQKKRVLLMTLNDELNQKECLKMISEANSGLRRLSYEGFKRKAREHQVRFREEELCVGYNIYPNVLNYSDACKGLVFYDGFRNRIMEELRKPILLTSTAPSSQLLTNLLRSEHIPYNIFFPMKNDLEGCTNMFNALMGEENIVVIKDIFIEYHPEPIKDYLNDHTAFDVYIAYIDTEGRNCGIGIEVKYTEKEYSLKKKSREYSHVKNAKGNTHLSPEYYRATTESGYYKKEVSFDILVSNKFRQIWRNHILGASMVLRGDIAKFTSITLYPQENIHFSMDIMPKYKNFITDEAFGMCIPLCYENLFNLMEKHFHFEGVKEWLDYLRRRYLFNCCIKVKEA